MMLNDPVCSRSDALNWKAWVRTLVVSLCLFLGKTLSCSEPFSPGVQLDSGEEATGNLTGFWGEPRLTSIIEGESINFCIDTGQSYVDLTFNAIVAMHFLMRAYLKYSVISNLFCFNSGQG